MREIVITPRAIRRELWILLGCLGAAVLVDLGAILYYDRPYLELLRTLGYVVAIALVLYLGLGLLRLLWGGLRCVLKSFSRKNASAISHSEKMD